MLSKLFVRYRFRVLAALTVALAIIATRGEKQAAQILLIVLGSIVGILILDLEYFIHAYWDNPDSEFSKGFKDLMDQKNYQGLIAYVDAHRPTLSKRILQSVLFQILLGGVALFLATSQGPNFGTAISLSAFVQTFYSMFEEYNYSHSINSWFWILKPAPSKSVQIAYLVIMGAFLVFTFAALR